MSLTNLPTELLYLILDLLNAEDILFAFRLVCRQFYSVTESYDRLRIQLTYRTSKTNIQRLCRIVRPDNVISLTLEKSHFNADTTEYFLQSITIHQFNRLRSLTLWNIEGDDLRTITTPLVMISILTSVTVSMSGNKEWDDDVMSLLQPVIAQASIRQLNLNIDSQIINAISWPNHCTVEKLTLRRCSYRQFCHIFDRSPNLRVFVLNDSRMRDVDSTIRPTTCRSLTSLTLKKIDMPMNDLEFFLSLQPCLISLTLTTKQSVSWRTFQHFSQWENFLRPTLPLLQQLNFSISNRCNKFKNIESVLLPLCTAYWLEEKHWFFTCQYTESFSFKTIQLCPSTYSTAQFPDNLDHANISYAITTMRSGNQANESRMWSARVDLTWMMNAILADKFEVPERHYFRHVSRLAFDVDVNPQWSVDALQRLSTWIDLSQLHEIWILETSACELRFDVIEFLLKQASQVRTFGLTYNDLDSRIADLGSVVSGRIDHFKVRGANIRCVKTTLKHIKHVSTITFQQLASGSTVLSDIIAYLTRKQSKFIVDYRAASIQIQCNKDTSNSFEMNRGRKRKERPDS